MVDLDGNEEVSEMEFRNWWRCTASLPARIAPSVEPGYCTIAPARYEAVRCCVGFPPQKLHCIL
jgi:hypothetical protein|eukprot:COSAG01_NODE_4814_length_4725_cov_2.208604_6_plen_64_part_00